MSGPVWKTFMGGCDCLKRFYGQVLVGVTECRLVGKMVKPIFFSSIKEITALLKEINRLLSKGMSNIYLKLLLRKRDVLKTYISHVQKVSVQVSFLGAPTHADINEFSNFQLFCCNLKIRGLAAKLFVNFLLFSF